MKWTMITVSMIGAVAYAVIFLAQSQNDAPSAEAVAGDVSVDVQSDFPALDPARVAALAPDDTSIATVALPEVSHPTNAARVATWWEGDAWTAGVQAFENGDFGRARTALEVAVQEKETSSYRHYLLGLTQRKLGDPEAAVVELERSLELAPGQLRALVNLGRAYLDLGDVDGAREAIDGALEIDLEYADAWLVLGRIELARSHFEEAAAAFARTVSKDPSNAWALNNLGYAKIQLGRFDEAIGPLREALATGREEAVFYNNLGVALERTGHEDLAVVAFGRAAVLGHEAAETSHARVESVLVARGETVPDFDAIESLDATTLAALVPVADERTVSPDEALTALGAQEFEAFDELVPQR